MISATDSLGHIGGIPVEWVTLMDGTQAPDTQDILEGLSGNVLVVNPHELLPGDIVLSTAAGFDSWLIRTATSSTFSHAALHVGHGIAIEANDPGVAQVYFPVIGHDAATHLAVKRMPELKAHERHALVQHALELLYRPYSTRGAVATIAPLLRKTSDPGRFCSQLVAHCYAMIERPICPCAPEDTTPEDIAASSVLRPVEGGIRYMPAALHAAISYSYASKYASYLERMPRFERAVVDKAKAELPGPIAKGCFNIFDLVRRATSPSLSQDVRTACDEVLSEVIGTALEEAPLRPCPGLSVATFLVLPVPIPPVSTRAFTVLARTLAVLPFRRGSPRRCSHRNGSANA
jgi:hypothetical protein